MNIPNAGNNFDLNPEVPLVSILLPINKENPYFLRALNSLINQSYPAIEILFVDSSSDGISFPPSILNKIRLLRVPIHFGISDSLNFGLEHAKGKYLARMDSDDICLPDRIREQVNFLQENFSISIVGSSVFLISEGDDSIDSSKIDVKPLTHKELELVLLHKTAFFHPTVMFRVEDLRKHKLHYRSVFDGAEDYDLWVRASHRLILANLSKPLVGLRIHSNQFSSLKKTRSDLLATWIKTQHLFWMYLHGKVETIFFLKLLNRNLRDLIMLSIRSTTSSK